MAISDKITSIQDHLKDDWDSVESLIGDTELDKNIENISSALDDLYNDLPKVTGSGTSITLDDTRKGRLESTLSGNTSQTQYTGKNLLPPTIATETKNGITLTNNGDGSYTLTGTYSTSTTFDMALPATLNGTYSFSGNNPTAGKNIQFRIVASSGSSLSTYLNNVNKTVENKTIENGTKQSIRIVGSFTSGFTFKPQLESGSTATSYEPYVGGVATPNPTNPADVNVVSGDNEILINGKNFLDNTKIVKGRIDNGVIGYESGTTSLNATNTSISFTTNANYRGVSTPYIELQNSVYFIINWQSADNTLAMVAHFYDKNQNYINQRGGYQSSDTSFRWANDVQNAKYVRITISLNSSGSVNVIEPQLQFVNDLNIPTYEPYQGNTYNIDLPVENLCNNDNILGLFLNFTNSTIGEADGSKTMYAKVPKNTELTVSRGTLTNRFRIGLLNEIPQNGGTFYLAYNGDSSSDLSKTINSGNYEYIAVQYTNQGENTNIQIEKGSKANSYTPYGTTPIELCKIGNYQDGFGKSDGSNLFNYNLFGTFTTTIQYVDITLKPNTTYTMSSNIPITSGVGTNLFFMKYGETASTSTNGVRPDTPVTLTTDSTGIVKVGYRTGTGVSANPKTDYWYMINEGSTALPWQPYGIGKWYLHKEIGKVVLNGSELWQIHGSIASWFYYDGLENVRYAISENLAISNYYSYKPYYPNATTLVNGEFTIGYGANNIGRVVMKNTDYTTVTNFKTWLSTHNTNVYYILATPTNTEITDTTLINQLEELYIAKSKENQTNISQINNDLGFIISASALKKDGVTPNNNVSLLMSVEESPNTNVEEETPIEESIEEEIDEEPVEEETEIEEEGE